jgi:hypothetical protein
LSAEGIYSPLGLPTKERAIPDEYEKAGRTNYEAFHKARGEHHFCPWEKLVWAEHYAWCEAARATKAV